MPVSADALWAWHTRPGALERLMPPWDGTVVLDRTGGLEDGARITLSVPVGPVRLRWVSRHRDCRPGRGFVDEQIEGPFARWVHTHAMIPDGPSASILEDRIEYAAPGGAPGRLLGRFMTERRLEALFRYRHETLRGDLVEHARFADRPRLTVAISGASGLVGTMLSHFLTTGGHRAIRLVRGRATAPETAAWDPERGLLDPDTLPRLDACIHLAGVSIGGARWTERRKAAIRHSRVAGTASLSRSLAALPPPRPALLCASAVGYYGHSTSPVTEADGPGHGFLAEVCQAWEAAADPAREAGLRVAHLRLAPVLSPAGGLLKVLLPLFKAGLGGPVGSGTQGFSWIAIDDVAGAFHQALFDARLAGPVNTSAPAPVSNAEFARTLGRVLGRPAVLPAPSFGVRLVLGREMADETALGGQWVLPKRLEESGYRFRHPALAPALAHLLGVSPG